MYILVIILVIVVSFLKNPTFCYNDDQNSALIEPPFPRVFSAEQLGFRQLHIVSEMATDFIGHVTIEEIIDIEFGKATLIETDTKYGRTITHTDAKTNLAYRYAPYHCSVFKQIEVDQNIDNFQGIWQAKVNLRSQNTTMHIYGVAALWFNVGEKSKLYSIERYVYSALKDIYLMAHKWTIRIANCTIHMYFSETKELNQPSKFSLESIQVQNIGSARMFRTINIISATNFEFDNDIYVNLLQPPIGFGCMSEEVTKKAAISWPDLFALEFRVITKRPQRLQFEAMATQYVEVIDNGIEETDGSSSDTIFAEVIRSRIIESNGKSSIQLIRQRDTNSDLVTIANYALNVQYKIDKRRGTCEISNMGINSKQKPIIGENNSEKQQNSDDDDDKEENFDEISLKFSNGLELDMKKPVIDELFYETKGFYFVKKIVKGKSGKYGEIMFFEKSSFQGKHNRRIIRAYYVVDEKTPIVLESVEIIFTNVQSTKILQFYRLNIVSRSSVDSIAEKAKLFDISEECYLNNEQMKFGRDYAKFEISYSFHDQFKGYLMAQTNKIKQAIYSMMEFEALNFLRVPKMELTFEGSNKLNLKVLLIDSPPLQVVYNLQPKKKLIITEGDQSELTIDLNHCADLCRLNKCKTMTFCKFDHTCLLSVDLPDGDKHRLVQSEPCNTYTIPSRADTNSRQIDIGKLSLHSKLSELRHQDYDSISLPVLPDILSQPKSVTRVTDRDYQKISGEYVENITNHMEGKIRYLTIITSVNGAVVVLLANKFHIEDDPMFEFNLNDSDENKISMDNEPIPSFHHGLSLHRYNLKIMAVKNNQYKAFYINNKLTYEQCALACIDNQCNSFSYCEYDQECIVTDIYNIGSVVDELTVQDSNCFIAQRDYLNKFIKFEGVYNEVSGSAVHLSTKFVQNAAECAHYCFASEKNDCLAFDLCEQPAESPIKRPSAICYLLKERIMFTSAEGKNSQYVTNKTHPKNTHNCDHYSRSYLADFARIEYTQIQKSELTKLDTTTIIGRNVDQCAEFCVSELIDCSAFQFCFDSESKGAKQKCTMIERKPERADQTDYEVVFNQTADGNEIVKMGKIFSPNRDCHVFALKQSSKEASQRELAVITKEPGKETDKQAESGSDLLHVLILMFCLSMLFAGIGCGVCLVKEHNEFVRQKINRARLLLRLM